MAERKNYEIVIPDARNYREGIPVLYSIDSRRRKETKSYDELGFRILNPLPQNLKE